MATALTGYNLSNTANSQPTNTTTNTISFNNNGNSNNSHNGYLSNNAAINNILNNNNNNNHNGNNQQQQNNVNANNNNCSQSPNSSSSLSASSSSSSSSPNLYRVGDYVYIELSPTSPYQVCKIEELVKNQNGNPEVKLVVFYRRRDISGSLFQQIEKQQISALEEDQEKEYEQLDEKQKHQIKLRELFLSRQIETYSVSSIRGKCQVTLLSEAESLHYYLKKDDAFFYTHVYDPVQKSLAEADRGEIRVGQKYQADVPAQPLDEPEKEDCRKSEDLETMVYWPNHDLSDKEIDKFLVISKSVGTYARALDCSSSVKQPSLLMSAASASRDVTVQYAMNVLHECNYDLAKAVCRLVPNSGPVLCRDEMEEWSTAETSLFDEAIDKCEKRFDEIQQNFLPWKSMKSLIEYYYFWKTTDRYVQRKRVKAVENESKLKQVFVPNYNKQTSLNGVNDLNVNKTCESCKKTSSSNWHVWGPANLQYFNCQSCWTFWRKFGAFKYPNRIADMTAEKLQVSSNLTNQSNNLVRASPINDLNPPYPCRECNKVFNRQERLTSHLASHRPHKCNVPSCGKEFRLKAQLAKHCANSHGVAIRSGSPRPMMKTRAAFYYNVVPALRLARNLCSDILNLKRSARVDRASRMRDPCAINAALFKQEYTERYESFQKGLLRPIKLKKIDRGKVNDISHRLGTPKMPKPEWLVALPKDKLPRPERLAFPVRKPEANSEPEDMSDQKDSLDTSRKRLLEHNGNMIPPSKRRQMAPPSILGKSVPDLYENISRNSVSTQSINGRAKIATITNISGKRQLISWVDAPDDVFLVSTKKMKQMRRKIPLAELLRAARQPYKRHYQYFESLVESSASSSAETANQMLPNMTSNRSAGQTSSSSSSSMVTSNKLNVHNPSAAAAAAAAAALNLAGITNSLSANSSQHVAALLQQQMLAQNLPLLGNANHLVASSNAFFNSLSPTNGGNSNSGGNKMNR